MHYAVVTWDALKPRILLQKQNILYVQVTLVIRTFVICGVGVSMSYLFPSYTLPKRCAHTFTDSSHHFESEEYRLIPLMGYHSEKPWAFICFLFYVFLIYVAIQKMQPHV
jgi:hypothetical protein